MSSIVTLIILVVLIVGMLSFTSRAKRRQAATLQAQTESIGIGSEVMTTSGLYGTVVERNDDDSVQLSIAPGIEVRWAAAALRTVDSLPARYSGDRVRLDKRGENGEDGPAAGSGSAATS